MPVTVVPTSLATSSIETFITELSSVIRNWPAASVNRTSWEPDVALVAGTASAVTIVLTPLTAPSGRRSPREFHLSLPAADLLDDDLDRVAELEDAASATPGER